MGLVLSAELLSVNYAAEICRFVLESFERVELVLPAERVFPGVLEHVVLLLVDGSKNGGPTDHAVIRHARNAAALAGPGPGPGRGGRRDRDVAPMI